MSEFNMIEQDQMLMELPHIAYMWYHRDTEFFRQEADGDEFTDPSHPDGIYLHESGRTGLQIVLEDDLVGYMFSQCEFDGGDCIG